MKRLFNTARLMLALLVITALSACAALGLQKAQSTEDNLRYGQAGVSAAYKTIGDLAASKSITVDEGISMFKENEAIEKDLTAAEPLVNGPQASTAAAKINLALQALVLLQNRLKAKQGKTSMIDYTPTFASINTTGA